MPTVLKANTELTDHFVQCNFFLEVDCPPLRMERHAAFQKQMETKNLRKYWYNLVCAIRQRVRRGGGVALRRKFNRRARRVKSRRVRRGFGDEGIRIFERGASLRDFCPS